MIFIFKAEEIPLLFVPWASTFLKAPKALTNKKEKEMEQYKKGSLKFINPKKVRKSKSKKQILLFISDDLVLTVNSNYLLKILTSNDFEEQQPQGEAS